MKGLWRSLPVYGGFRGFSSRGELRLDGVMDIVAVASGKGGVGKSTTAGIPHAVLKLNPWKTEVLVAVNLAVALANVCQLKVGLLDADIYGPSVPTMMQIHEKPDVTEDKKMVPIEKYAVKCMSMGLLVEKDAPIVWRGPMVMNALEKLTRGVHWGNLDILIVDMPPGTGDTQISMTQRLQLSGALIVSTPQDVALIDARRGAKMFAKVQVPILGIIENMSYFKCPHCGEPSFIFGKGGSQRTADETGLECIAEIPLQGDIRESSDEGLPIVLSAPKSAVSRAYSDLAHKVVEKLKGLAEQQLPHMELHL